MTGSAYSAIVLPDGQVRARSQLGAPALLRERVPLRTGLTPFARFGDAPALALAAALILLPKWPRRQNAPCRVVSLINDGCGTLPSPVPLMPSVREV
ncbi:MAG: hypothetical protein M4D85_01940 [Actinomycetota bacterium]|nr:hypothetical protein [Actinomycetota bacterium]